MADTMAAKGKLEGFRQQIRSLHSLLEVAPSWKYSAQLQASCLYALDRLDALEARLEQKLVVAIIGPQGSGKSTFLNALVGDDNLSPTGLERPTTKSVVVCCRDSRDAEPLLDVVDLSRVDVVTSSTGPFLEHAILVDTPDTDSNACAQHMPIVERVIEMADVLLCVFNAENPKRRDNIEFLAPLVRIFPGEQIFAVLTKCDRVPEDELRQTVVPDFERHLGLSWKRDDIEVVSVSARSHLKDPAWVQDENPLHALDQFTDLRRMIEAMHGQGSLYIDTRIRQAEALLKHLCALIRDNVDQARATVLTDAEDKILRLKQTAIEEAARGIRDTGAGVMSGAEVIFYRRLSQLWVGPVSWMLSVYSRYLIFGPGLLGMLRFGRPLNQVLGLISAARRAWKSGKSIDDSLSAEMEMPLRIYRKTLRREWPGTAEQLIEKAGFDPSVRGAEKVFGNEDSARGLIGNAWESAMSTAVEQGARSLSRGWIQFLLNIPVVALLIFISWQVVWNFVHGNIFSGEYFLHALATVLLVSIVTFMILQVFAGRSRGEKLLAKAFEALLASLETEPRETAEISILREIRALILLRDRVVRLGVPDFARSSDTEPGK